jgi:uncharacterized protein YbjT (DUF2867 family)
MSPQVVLVIRATGTQGTAVIKHLRKNNLHARAYVTNANDERALAVEALGAELHEGTLDDEQALRKALSGCTGLFLNQMPSFQDDSELRHAKLILEVARSAGVKHVVHSTSLGVPRAESIARTGSIVAAAISGKADVEELVQKAGFEQWTILRGGYFMTNFLGFTSKRMLPELSKEKKFVCSYKPDTLLPLIDPYDIGAFAVAAFRHPERFNNQVIPLSTENVRVDQVVKDLGNACGQPIQAVYRSDEETEALAKTNPMVAGAKWMTDLYKEGDIEGVKGWGVPLHSFTEFLERENELVQATFA